MAKKKKEQAHVFIYPDWCKGCGLCVAFCPKKVFEMEATGKARVAREKDCVNCGFCELHCPDFAIQVAAAAAPDHSLHTPGPIETDNDEVRADLTPESVAGVHVPLFKGSSTP